MNVRCQDEVKHEFQPHHPHLVGGGVAGAVAGSIGAAGLRYRGTTASPSPLTAHFTYLVLKRYEMRFGYNSNKKRGFLIRE